MNDEVSNPAHYNQNGIEVIDVIETYAKDDFRLANVIKYVCRADYKGNKLKDLQKAAWYLNRVIEELDPPSPGHAYTEREVEAFFDGYDFREEQEALEDAVPWERVKEDALLRCPPDRIPGDDAAAQKLKDDYYSFDRYAIVGYCVNCDAEIAPGDPWICAGSPSDTFKVCGVKCYVATKGKL